MQYYTMMKMIKNDLDEIFDGNSGHEVALPAIELKFMTKYGVSTKSLRNILKIYERNQNITIQNDIIQIK